MMKRHFVLMCLTAPALTAAGQDRPNMLFIAIDDLRPELGCYGSDIAITPSMDKLAAGGMVFERAYCNIAMCGASRASLLSGKHPIAGHRFRNFKTRLDEDVPGVPTLPQLFKEAGYTTLSNGKIFHHADTGFRSNVYVRHGAADTVFTEHFAYTRYRNEDGPKMLFDHRKNPDENQNLVEDPAFREMARELDALLTQRMDQAKGEADDSAD